MDSNLKELIEMATASGTISQVHEKLILEKALMQGISETEIRLYIDSAIRRNSKLTSPQIHSQITNNSEGFNIKEFSLSEWVMFSGILITALAGFFPWVSSSVSSGVSVYRYSGGASVGGGFIYSIPLAASAFLFFYKKSLHSYRIYEGLGIILISVALIFSYSNKVSWGGGGISASATTKAGAGVILLLLGGIIYTTGAVLHGRSSKDNSGIIKVISHPLIRIVLLFLLTLIPGISMEDLKEKNIELLYMGIILAAIPFFISRKSGFKRFETTTLATALVFAISLLIPRYSDNNVLINLSEAFYLVTSWYFVFIMALGAVALLGDYQNTQSKSFGFADTIKSLFNYKLIFGAYLLLFILIFGLNVFTKHRVTREEVNAFVERNEKICGDWYFLCDDSASLYEMKISLNESGTNDNGTISFKYTAYLYNDNVSLQEIDYQEKMDTKDYSDSATYPIEFNKGLKIASLSVDKIMGSFIANGREINFSAYRNSDYLNNLILTKNNQLSAALDPLVDTSALYLSNSEDFIDEQKLYKIQDPDGYTNLRVNPDGEIIKRVYDSDRFFVVGQTDDYYNVRLADGIEGFLHKSRVILAD